ncbi:hypothetical protein FEM48_Zijuj02G0046700 [Ziziphus jujuba var. spinosa]|uniref:Hydroxyproline O-arabinosyltransferase-like domain-containing protein n=1 Tax=Ziziphus jujuba var. spinosa TaxID=714518 RepID=A0A978VTP4_ZIZJJ|nr:hypothetical protein FEM48_Zijuj02G0046700 [Ziziphus jujuba var. spinosa]
MIGRKNIGRSSPVLLVLLALGFFFATYNLITLIIHNKASISGSWMWDGTELFDPVIQRPDDEKSAGNSKKYHVALTATDAPYSQWQCRIMYYWYKKMKDMPGSDMGKFTRVLHSGSPDNLMEEIPSFVVDPLPQGLDRGYIVLNRPWAFVQWLEKATIEEDLMLQSLLEDIAPTWVNVSLRMKDDEETDKAFGWVLEILTCINLIFQPPWDLEVGKKFIIHYTYGCDYNLKGELTYGKIGEWRFDKRSYLSGPPPRNLPLPPPGVPESVVRLVKMVNEATANIPGWDTLSSG